MAADELEGVLASVFRRHTSETPDATAAVTEAAPGRAERRRFFESDLDVSVAQAFGRISEGEAQQERAQLKTAAEPPAKTAGTKPSVRSQSVERMVERRRSRLGW